MTGSITLSWNAPDWPATVTVTSLPMTCAATIVTASGTTGLTLPGMMLLPGCSAGRDISLNPASGPLFIQRRSLAIFIRLTASVRNWPDSSTAVSCAASEAKKSRLGRRSRLVCFDSRAAARAANSGGALIPVPTAVPPSASACSRGRDACRRAMPSSTWVRQAPISCASVSGIASIRCVRPVLTVSPTSAALRASVSDNSFSAGSRCSAIASAAPTWITVGITSLLLWLRLT
jgi:hypothetical protein